jgi:hypothetical protein
MMIVQTTMRAETESKLLTDHCANDRGIPRMYEDNNYYKALLKAF